MVYNVLLLVEDTRPTFATGNDGVETGRELYYDSKTEEVES